MSDPFECYEKLDFNTRKQPLYSHVIQRFPKPNEAESVIRLCRCWQSHKFPYCDDTHKLLVEAGDDVGPFVARLRSETTGKRQYVKLRQHDYVPGMSSSTVLHRIASPRSALLVSLVTIVAGSAWALSGMI
ncbi:zinc finger cdgsh type protein [Babesia ovis]|uniref:Zinc finger cdgsh type protein n=1 Tax=Babesia ovis TaxID=5869 RepID=A0A9W5TDQ3_BABOV|nr:zinc finger cdgsh type protein [Babesia ovis]